MGCCKCKKPNANSMETENRLARQREKKCMGISLKCKVSTRNSNVCIKYIPVIRTRVSLPERSVTCCSSMMHIRLQVKSGNTGEKKSLATYNECVIERCKDVGHSKNMLTLPDCRSKGNIFFLWLSSLLFRL